MSTLGRILILAAVSMWVLTLGGCPSTSGDGGLTPADGTSDGTGGGGDGGGDNEGGDNGADDGTDGGGAQQLPALIKTHIELKANGLFSSAGKIEAGDDLVVYGLAETGIFYFTASTADADLETATEIPNSAALFGDRNFKVAGGKIALVRSNNRVAIWDTETATLSDNVPDIVLHALPTDANRPGHMTADGTLIATINDPSETADGNALKVIDVSGDTPTVISFPTPEDFFGTFGQVAVDAETRTLLAYGSNPGVQLYVFDLDAPDAPPLGFDLFETGFQESVQMAYDDGVVLYNQGDDVVLLDVTAAGNTPQVFTNNPSNLNATLALAGGSFAYFVFAETADMGPMPDHLRTAIGAVSQASAATLAEQFDAVFSDGPPECVQEGGLLGYGSSVAITPDGERWFLAGIAAPEPDYDFLQMSTGGKFRTFDDPDGDTATGLVMATDVSCSENTVAFRALRQAADSGCLTNDAWVIGFIVLERLTD